MAEAITEVTVDLNGVRLYTRRVGHGPPVVVLHGGPGAHHDYLLPQYDHLAEGGRALLYYDQRGGGRSPVPRDVPVGWREHVADLEALRVYWELDRLTVVGYSWGGLLALLYALEHPDRIARLALSVAGYFRDPSHAREMTPFRVTERTRKAVWASLGSYDLRQRIRQTFPSGTAPRSLLLHGVYDPMPLEAARETAALLSTGVIELATGHVPHVEATEQFERALDGFLPHD